jgi:hypothetical protein
MQNGWIGALDRRNPALHLAFVIDWRHLSPMNAVTPRGLQGILMQVLAVITGSSASSVVLVTQGGE